MSKNARKLIFVGLLLIMLACSSLTQPVTATPPPTLTKAPTLTPIPSPTLTPTPSVEDVLLKMGFTRETDMDQFCERPCRTYFNQEFTSVVRDYDDGSFTTWFEQTNNIDVYVQNADFMDKVVNAVFGLDYGTWVYSAFTKDKPVSTDIGGRHLNLYLDLQTSTNFGLIRLDIGAPGSAK